jgi:DNA-binding MarR family transcriptional regulator
MRSRRSRRKNLEGVDENGLPVGELERRARTATNLAGMQRWGYITIEKDPADQRPKPPRSAWVVRATPVGRKAREVWQPLIHAIEKRWQQRFGKDEIAELWESLWAVARQLDLELPDYLPILGYGLFSQRPDYERRASARSEDSPLPLPALLSRVLLAFAIEFETESDLSFAISANILRVLDEKGVRLRDIPLLTGLSKEAISMGMGILRKKRLAVVEPDPSGSRAKVARLTPKGREAKDAYRELLINIEQRWQARFGKDTIHALREPLEQLVGQPTARQSLSSADWNPYPEGWRASVRKPETLPHYPNGAAPRRIPRRQSVLGGSGHKLKLRAFAAPFAILDMTFASLG